VRLENTAQGFQEGEANKSTRLGKERP